MTLRDSYRRHKFAYFVGVVCWMAILGGGYYYRGRSKDPGYIRAPVRRGDITASVQATGTINPLDDHSGRFLRFRHGPIHFCRLQHARSLRPGSGPDRSRHLRSASFHFARGNLENAWSNLVTLAANVQVDEANLAKSQANVKYQTATARRSQ